MSKNFSLWRPVSLTTHSPLSLPWKKRWHMPSGYGVAHRLLFYVLFFSSCVTLASTVVQVALEVRADVDGLNRRLDEIGAASLETLESNLWTIDFMQVQKQLEGILRLPDIQSVQVRSEEGLVLFAGKPAPSHWPRRVFELNHVEHSLKHRLGTLEVVANLNGVLDRIRQRIFVILFSQGIKTFLVSFFILSIFRTLVTRHLTDISRHITRIDANSLDQPLRLDRKIPPGNFRDELESVAHALNTMQHSLQGSYRAVRSELSLRAAAEAALEEQREWLNVTVTSIGDGIVALDTFGLVRLMNPVAAGMLACQVGASVGKPLEALLEGNNDGARGLLPKGWMEEIFSAKCETGVHFGPFPMRGSLKSAPLEVSIRATPIGNKEGGKPMGAVLVFVDVTERSVADRKRTFFDEVHLRLESAKLDLESSMRGLLEATVPFLGDWAVLDITVESGGFQRTQVHHKCPEACKGLEALRNQNFNRLGTQTFAASEALLTRRAVHRIIGSPEELAQFCASPHELRYFESLDICSFISVPLVTSSQEAGVLTLLRSTASGVHSDDDLGIAQELGRRAGLALENAQLYRESLRLNRAKDEFLATISHELRTPLNAICGWSDLLQCEELDAETQALALKTIHFSACAQARLIDDILEVSRIITGTLRLEARPVALDRVLALALETVHLSAKAKGISIDIQGASAYMPLMIGDAGKLQQVIWNLLANAIKFTPSGGKVAIELRTFEKEIEFSVSDNGEGIGPEFLPFVFDRFRQEDGQLTRTHGGLGLGLALVRHIIELHGGTIFAESRGKGLGSRFVFRLARSVAAS